MGKHKRRRDPIADYIEWSNNRYNPGHYLGGNIPPHMQPSSMEPGGLRSATILQIISAAVTVGLLLIGLATGLEFSAEWILRVAATVLVVWAAVVMYRRSRGSSTRRKKSRRW